MINDDIEFLPQDSFFICMGDDGKPVFGRFESRPHYDGKFCAVVRYNREVYRAGSESRQRAARMLIDHFFKINVRHRIDGLENCGVGNGYWYAVRHRIDGLESWF